jgi:deazaflavin-dependent oxidoreductase (nitroreductase family)
MARTYRLGAVRRMINRIVSRRIEAGKPAGDGIHLLTTVGRRSGLERTIPVTIVETGGHRWLVAPYGPVGWVHNVRASGTATLTAEGVTTRVRVTEADPAEAAPVLKHYVTRVKVVRPYFDASFEDPVEAFEALAAEKPVFRIEG